MDKTFDNKEVLDELIRKLEMYRDEKSLDSYSDQCFIEDILYFVGVSVNELEYCQASGYRKFIMRYVRPFVERINKETKTLFQHRLGKTSE